MPDPTMPEPTNHGTDEVVAQLRRYADAAERTVPSTHTTIGTVAAHRGRTSPWRPLAVAAVVVALLTGGAFALSSLDDDRAVETVERPEPQVPLPDPAPDLDEPCPAPRADGPQVADLRVLLPYVASATSDTTTDGSGTVDSMRIEVGDGGPELRVAEVGEQELAETFPVDPADDRRATFEICDPFTADERPGEVRGDWAVGQDQRLRAELGLVGGGRGWLVTVSVPLDGRDPTSEQPDSARADVRRLVAGMIWPAPVEEPRRNDVCANEPVAAVANHQLLAVPEGYTLGEPEEVDTGAVDMGGEQWTRLPLLGPDGARIDVISIGTARFTEGLANNAVGIEPGSLTIQRCRAVPVQGGEDTAAGSEELTEIRRGADRIVIGAQESEYGGWMVIGTGGATEDDVIATAEALRS